MVHQRCTFAIQRCLVMHSFEQKRHELFMAFCCGDMQRSPPTIRLFLDEGAHA